MYDRSIVFTRHYCQSENYLSPNIRQILRGNDNCTPLIFNQGCVVLIVCVVVPIENLAELLNASHKLKLNLV